MLLEIQKWGNSAAIRLSQGLLREFSSEIGSKVRASVVNGKLTLEPVVEMPEYSLDELLEGSFRESFAMTEEDRSWLASGPVRKEIW